MKQYLDLLHDILRNGTDKKDRTGVGTRSIFGYQMRFNLQDGFPATTSKRLAWKAVVGELLWFIEGSRDERRLAEITHGSRDKSKNTIWTENAEAPYWKPKAEFNGDLGRVYGVQWRFWRKSHQFSPQAFIIGNGGAGGAGGLSLNSNNKHEQELGGGSSASYTTTISYPGYEYVDQLINLVDGLKKDPNGRRHILTAWNPGELDLMALPPCHCFAQFDVTNGKLSCQMYQRSVDSFLGLPFNIASYSLFTHMLAQVCGYEVGDFIWIGGDTHIYRNHFDQVEELLTRTPKQLPTLVMNKEVKVITDFKLEDFKLENYDPYPPIKAEMAVGTK